MSKDLLKHVLVLLPLETISMFIFKDAVKKKIFEKIRKTKSRTSPPQNCKSKGLTPT